MGQVSSLYATLTPTPFVVPISNGSGLLDDWVTPSLTNPMTTDQDLIVGGFGGDPTRLAVGPVSYVLTVGSAGVIDWAPSTGGFANPMTTYQDLIVGGVAGAPGRLGVGAVGRVLTVGSGGIIDWEAPAAAGVTTVSVVSANGFAGSVANPTTTPAITLTTTITGLIKGNGTALSAASAGTDYVAPGAIITSGLTMATGKMLGRATASTGAIEEIATTGTGSAVLATSPTLVTPALGTPSAIVLTNGTGLPIAGITGLGTGIATWLATPSSANLAAAVTDETGTGALVFATSPTLVTPALGTPTAIVLTSGTGLPLTTGVTGILPIANGGTATATPALVAGTNITITGTWPNNTITAAAAGADYLALMVFF